MLKQILFSSLSSLIGAGVVAGGALFPISSAVSDEPSSQSVHVSSQYEVMTTFNPSRVSLTNGTSFDWDAFDWDVTGPPSWTMSDVPATIDKAAYGFAVSDDSNRPDINAAAKWQITMFGEPTDYWIAAQVIMTWNVFFPNTRGRCEVYQGDPDFGGTVMEVSPIICSATVPDRRSLHNHVTFDIGLNRWAEVSGTVKTLDHVSLSDGVHSTGVPRFTMAATQLDSNATTDFNAVLLESEQNREFPDQARMEMRYRIFDDGAPTDYAVTAMATNHRGFFAFNPNAQCRIVDLRGAIPDEPIGDAPYTCSTVGAVVKGEKEDGNGHYRATFTVARAQSASTGTR